MTIRIIDNKKVDLTDSEFKLYQEICKDNSKVNFKGELLFQDLFESDKDGIIYFIRPSNKKYASMEAFLFIVAVMVHQHLRISASETDKINSESKQVLEEMKKELAEIKELKEKLK